MEISPRHRLSILSRASLGTKDASLTKHRPSLPRQPECRPGILKWPPASACCHPQRTSIYNASQNMGNAESSATSTTYLKEYLPLYTSTISRFRSTSEQPLIFFESHSRMLSSASLEDASAAVSSEPTAAILPFSNAPMVTQETKAQKSPQIVLACSDEDLVSR